MSVEGRGATDCVGLCVCVCGSVWWCVVVRARAHMSLGVVGVCGRCL